MSTWKLIFDINLKNLFKIVLGLDPYYKAFILLLVKYIVNFDKNYIVITWAF